MKLFIERVLCFFILAAVISKVISGEFFDGRPAYETVLPDGEGEEVLRPGQPDERTMDLLRAIQIGQEETGQLNEGHTGASSEQVFEADSETEQQSQDYGSSGGEDGVVVPVASLPPPRQSSSEPNDQLEGARSGEMIRDSFEPEGGGSQAVMHANLVADGAEGGLDEGDLEEDGPGGEGGQPVNLVLVPFSERQQVYFLQQRANALPGLDREQARIETFQEWARGRAEVFPNTLFQDLARQNLAIVRLPDESEEGNLQYYVVCVTCDHYLGRAESFLRFYQCQGVGHRSCLSRDNRKKQKGNSDYSSSDVRVSTYSGCPPLLYRKRNELSASGFYFLGWGDSVRCYSCNLGVRNWQENDDPPVEHYQWEPNCGHLQQKFNVRDLRRMLVAMQDSLLASAEGQQTGSHTGVGQSRNGLDENGFANNLLEMSVAVYPSLLQEVIDRAPPGANENQVTSTYLDAQPDHERKKRQMHSAKPSDSQQLKRGEQRAERPSSRSSQERQDHLKLSPTYRAAVTSDTREANQPKPKKEAKRQPGKDSRDRKPERRRGAGRVIIMHPEGMTVISNENVVQIGTSNRVFTHRAAHRQRVPIQNEVYQAAENMIQQEFGQVDEEVFNSIAIQAIAGNKKTGARDILKSYREALSKKENGISEPSHGQIFSGAEGGSVRASIVERARSQPIPYFLSQNGMRVLSRVHSSLRDIIVSNSLQILEQLRQNHGRDPESWEFYQELLHQGVITVTENRHSESVRLVLVSYEAVHAGADQTDVFSRIENYEFAFLKEKSRFPNTMEILQHLEKSDQRRKASQ